MRINHPALNDIEKRNCRISPNALELMQVADGNNIYLESATSEMRNDMRRIIDELGQQRNRDKSEYKNIFHQKVNKYFCSINLPNDLYLRGDTIFNDKRDINYILTLIDFVYENKYPKRNKEFIRNLKSIAAYGEWMDNSDYYLQTEKIKTYAYNEKSEGYIRDYQQEDKHECWSMEALYADSDRIFNMHPDIETIRLDKYYRDRLSLYPLDMVKVKRRLLDNIKDEIIEYGLVFMITLFAAITALNQSNIHLIRIGLPLSIVVTVCVMYIKLK